MAKFWKKFSRFWDLYEKADAARGLPEWAGWLFPSVPGAGMSAFLGELHPALSFALVLFACTCGAIFYVVVVLARRDKERPDRVFGAALYPFFQATDDRSGEHTSPYVKFSYKIINAETEDVEIVDLDGNALLESLGMGEPKLDERAPIHIYQGGFCMIQASMTLTPGGVKHLNQVKDRTGKHGAEYNFIGDVRLKLRGKKSGKTADVSLPNPTT